MKVKVPLFGNVARTALIDPEATKGATIGGNLLLPNGQVATKAALIEYLGITTTSGGVSSHRLLQGLTLGDDHPMYTRKGTLTTRGDLYKRGVSTVERLALGTVKQVLRAGATDPAWATLSPIITLGTDLSGSVTLTDLENGTLNATIVANSVTDTKLRDSAAVSVIGRSANTSGDPADIAAASNDTILRRTANTLNFGLVTGPMLGTNIVSYSNIQQVSVTARILGRTTAGAGNIEELTGAQAAAIVVAGSDKQLQYNDGGALAGDADLTWDKATDTLGAKNVTVASLLRLAPLTVATLPAAATAGFPALAAVTDATATTRLSVVAGSGANKVIVFSDGTDWLIL